MFRTRSLRTVVSWIMLLLMVGFVGPARSLAVTEIIGDVDGFGFALPLAPPAEGPNSAPDVTSDGSPDVDQNQNGLLEPGDYLPDLDNDGSVHVTRNDEFDNRSASELAAVNGAQWTDVALETGNGPGRADGALFTFDFSVPAFGEIGYEQDHFVNIIAGDLDTGTLQAFIDGTTVPLQDVGTEDGLITLTNAAVAWADMLDGQIVVELNTPSEPYVAVDYVLLDLQVSEAPQLATTPNDEGELDFSLVRVGGSADRTLAVANAGGQGSQLTGQAGGPAGPSFTGPAEDPNFSLGQGEQTEFTYAFTPAGRGGVGDSVTVASNDPTDPNGHAVTFIGQGVGPEAAFAFHGSDVPPGSVLNLGTTDLVAPVSASFTIRNDSADPDDGDSGLTDLTILSWEITGADADLFDLAGLAGGEVIGQGGQLDLTLWFTPDGSDGIFPDATLTLVTDQGVLLGQVGEDFRFDLAAEAVPEPASLAVLSLGLGGLLVRRRRR